MISCREFAVLLLDYLDRELTDEQRHEVDDHLCHCPPCATYLETYSFICAMPQHLPQVPVPAPLIDRLRAALTQAWPRPGTSSL